MKMPSNAWQKPGLFILSLLPLVYLVVTVFADWLGANPIEALTRSLGDWALRFLLVTLAITPLRLFSGWSGWVRFRRMLGLFSFLYACLHLSSYIVLDQFFAWDEIWADIIKRPYITFGMSAFLLLVPLAVTSTKGWIRRLGRNWQRLHWLVYPAAIGAVVHFYLMVKADIREPLIYGAILAILLGTRLPPIRSAIQRMH